MAIELTDIYENAVPTVLVPLMRQVVAKVGVNPTSVYRGDGAESILNKYGKHTQRQLYDATPAQRAAWGVLGQPNRPGTSTHECCSDGVAFSGPMGRRIPDYQCGQDWPDSTIWTVMSEYTRLGERPFHPYASGIEYHHIDLLDAPKRPALWFLPLEVGMKGVRKVSSGLWVYILASRLTNCGYLPRPQSKYDYGLRKAVEEFQGLHHLQVDGICGVQTWVNAKAAEAWCKKHNRHEWPVKK